MQLTLVYFSVVLVAVCCFQRHNRILYGSDAKDGEFPSMVSLQKDGLHTCGGAILDKNHILTAAHCVKNCKRPNRIDPCKRQLPIKKASNNKTFVVAGNAKLTGKNKGILVEKIKIHDNYSCSNNAKHDIAIIRLKKPLIFGDKIKPTVLPTSDLITPIGAEVIAAGWGRTTSCGKSAANLQKIALNVIECTKSNNSTVCAGRKKNHICYGDSGSPLFMKGVQIGIVSSAMDQATALCHEGRGAQFVRVSKYLKWIETHKQF